MNKHTNVFPYLKYSLSAALLYCIPVLIFIRNATYTDAWLLYLGNGFFLMMIGLFMLYFNGKREDNASSATMLISGHVVTAMGTILACLFSFILLLLMVPGLFDLEGADKVLTESPANHIKGNTDGLSFMVFANAIFGNVSVGSFISILFAFTAKRDQTRESQHVKEQRL